MVPFSIVCALFAQGKLLGNIFSSSKFHALPGRSPDIIASASRDENCVLIIRHLTTLASSASVIQISGGSRLRAKEGVRVFLLALHAVLPSAIFFTQNKGGGLPEPLP